MTNPANPSDNGPNPPAVARQTAGHELPFVTPSTYLHLPTRPLANASSSPAATAAHGQSRTVPQPAQPDPAPVPEKPPMTPLDRDQVQGLVSNARPFGTLKSCSETYPIPRSSYLISAFPLRRTGEHTRYQKEGNPSFAFTGCQSHVGEAFCLSRRPVVTARHAYGCGVQLVSSVGAASTGKTNIYVHLPTYLPFFRIPLGQLGFQLGEKLWMMFD